MTTHLPNEATCRLVDGAIALLLPLTNRLEDTLRRETRALAVHDIDMLLSAVREKQTILRELQTMFMEGVLSTVLGKVQGLSAEALAAAVPSWPTFVASARRCRALNESLGGPIASLRRDTGAMLSLLGVSAEPPAYEADGLAPPQHTVRSLGIG